MANEILIAVIFTFILVALGAAWVGGYLDAYQSKAQEKALDMMGENKGTSIGAETGTRSTLPQISKLTLLCPTASYGIKSMLDPRPIVQIRQADIVQVH